MEVDEHEQKQKQGQEREPMGEEERSLISPCMQQRGHEGPGRQPVATPQQHPEAKTKKNTTPRSRSRTTTIETGDDFHFASRGTRLPHTAATLFLLARNLKVSEINVLSY
jgi:hypothetical protein